MKDFQKRSNLDTNSSCSCIVERLGLTCLLPLQGNYYYDVAGSGGAARVRWPPTRTTATATERTNERKMKLSTTSLTSLAGEETRKRDVDLNLNSLMKLCLYTICIVQGERDHQRVKGPLTYDVCSEGGGSKVTQFCIS